MIGLFRSAAAAFVLFAMAATAPAFAQKRLQQTVDAGQPATYGEFNLSAGFTPDPKTITVTSGGSIDASTVSSGCVGMVARAPDIQISYEAGSLPLSFSTNSSVDSTLMINGPDGRWSCDDDSGSGALDASLTFRNPRSGIYDVWVGAYGGNSGSVDLYVSELGRDGSSASAGSSAGNAQNNVYSGAQTSRSGGYPDATLNATFGNAALSAGFTGDPYIVQVASGGTYDASGLGGACVGMIASAPDFQLTYSAGSLPLTLSVNSSSDTTLIVNGPDGRWYCDDDSGNLGSNPMVRFSRPTTGTYDIWVGSYAGRGAPAELNISELYSQ